MKPGKLLKMLCMATALGCGFTAHAGTVWNETANGDLSNNGLQPTALSMSIGPNAVLGTVGNSGQGIDRDYFRFTVPAGAVLASIRLLGNTSVSGGASFIAIQAGAQLTVTPSGQGVENLLGFTHYSNDQIGTDILPDMAISFTGALPAGAYSIWVQDNGGPATYGLEFLLNSTGGAADGDVPTLPEWGMLLMGTLLAGTLWRQDTLRRRSAKRIC